MKSVPTILLLTIGTCLSPAQQAFSADDAPSKAEVKAAPPAPVLLWSFEGKETPLTSTGSAESPLTLEQRGKVTLGVPGPRPSEYPDFAPTNTAVRIAKGSNYLTIKDPGDDSVLDFKLGDSITLACWVRWDEALSGTHQTLIAKGRTLQGSGTTHNHNYALRLENNSSGVFPNFLFSDEQAQDNPKSGDPHWHRWTGKLAIPEDGAWHHVAVTYTYGKPDSMTGYVDGVPTGGKWDMGGKTELGPVVDNDDLCIGSSMSGRVTFSGEIDEAAIYRRALSAEEVKAYVNINIEASGVLVGQVDPETIPTDHVQLEIMDRVPVARSWKFRTREFKQLHDKEIFALKNLPRKYNEKGLIIDRPVPSLYHMASRIDLQAGEYELLVRSLDSVRMYVNGDLVAETPWKNLNGSAHGPYYELDNPGPELLSLSAGHKEQRAKVTLEAGNHLFSLYGVVGNKGKGDYLGEVCVGIGPVGGPYRFLSPNRDLPFTDDGWLTFLEEDRIRLRKYEQAQRLAVSESERDYWVQRHEYARQVIGDGDAFTAESIDELISVKLMAENRNPMPITDDFSFLRRVTLDTIGVIPTPEQIEQFFADPPEIRRELLIDRLLAHPGWADHWVGYWQDVLAENPGLTKPELNNSGPFRWFLYESFLDNKPIDRFVTELVMMEGSAYSGGPAGFSIATQNDVPMAAKAHVLGTAFLGIEMKCARCHDAPYHDLSQGDLFSLAAMLKRGPQGIPATSSVPIEPGQEANSNVTVSIKPGESVKPDWPFVEMSPTSVNESAFALPAEFIRSTGDTRELLAAQITSPNNLRFAKVIVNRLWKRFLGRGLVEPVDDWEEAEPTHPELLERLAIELIRHDYDIKHIAQLILSSDVYQRISVPVEPTATEAELFAGPIRHRMTGEQLLDSLFLAAGKDFDSEELTMDRDGKQPDSRFGHLGIPDRAWEFIAVSNERDRPSLNLPVAQSLIDLMAAYNWRHQRQDPLTDREEALTPLQPMALAHGTAASRAIDFSDQSRLTALALQDQPVDQFVEQLFQRILTRPPTTDERQSFIELLGPGYDARIVAGPEAAHPRRIFRSGITWSNHFDPKSDDEAMARQRDIVKGELPTERLAVDWRKRAEDATWVLVNLPEFLIVP